MTKILTAFTAAVFSLAASAHAVFVNLENVDVSADNADGEAMVFDDGTFQVWLGAYTVDGTAADPEFNAIDDALISNAFGVGIRTGFFDPGQIDGISSQEALFVEIRDSGTGQIVEFTEIAFNLALSTDNVTVFAGNGIDDLSLAGLNIPIPPFNQVVSGSIVASSLMLAAFESDDGFYVESIEFNPVPIPGALPLMAAGLGGLAFARKKRAAR